MHEIPIARSTTSDRHLFLQQRACSSIASNIYLFSRSTTYLNEKKILASAAGITLPIGALALINKNTTRKNNRNNAHHGTANNLGQIAHSDPHVQKKASHVKKIPDSTSTPTHDEETPHHQENNPIFTSKRCSIYIKNALNKQRMIAAITH